MIGIVSHEKSELYFERISMAKIIDIFKQCLLSSIRQINQSFKINNAFYL